MALSELGTPTSIINQEKALWTVFINQEKALRTVYRPSDGSVWLLFLDISSLCQVVKKKIQGRSGYWIFHNALVQTQIFIRIFFGFICMMNKLINFY